MILILFHLVNDYPFSYSVDNLYEELMKIPESLILKEYTAIIVPAFEFFPKMKVYEQRFASEFAKYIKLVPTTKQDLNECMLSSPLNCTIFRDKSHLHEYLITEWFEDGNTLLYKLPCLRGDRQEPYVVFINLVII